MGKTSLKSVLRKFLNYYQDIELHPERYKVEFQSLKQLTESLRHDPDYSCSEGLKDVNRRKNRYKDILPYDRTRVVISEYPGVPGSDYINANYVRGSTGSTCAYIASQGPLPNTLIDFWRMIWECETTVIVMACNESESGKYKCESYWPNSEDEVQQYGNIQVKLVKWKNVCPDFLVRTLEISQEEVTRTVIQFHYGTWPDHGVPVAVTPILELVRLMRDVQATETRPILVHCSAGCGRTGTICSIDFVWALLRAGKLNNDFSLYNIIYDMRKQRIAMVQTIEQYQLCYKAVAALFQQQLKIIDAHTYENLDEDGEPLILRSMSFDSRSLESTDDHVPDPPQFVPLQTNVKSFISDSDCRQRQQQQFETRSHKLTLTTETTTTATVNPSIVPQNHSPLQSISTIRRAPSLDSIISSNLNTSAQFPDKLVGRATVIRRPSIAKLKAMFENLHTTNNSSPAETSTQQSQQHQILHHRQNENERRLKLQRSQSTRERGPSRISVVSRPSTDLLSVMDISSHETTIVAKQRDGLRRVVSSNNMTNEDSGESRNSSTDGSETDSGCIRSSGQRSETIEKKRLESASSLTNSSQQQQQHPRSILKGDSNVKSPPPKPPRTYIYDSIVNDRERGRIIARVPIDDNDDDDVDEREQKRYEHSHHHHRQQSTYQTINSRQLLSSTYTDCRQQQVGDDASRTRWKIESRDVDEHRKQTCSMLTNNQPQGSREDYHHLQQSVNRRIVLDNSHVVSHTTSVPTLSSTSTTTKVFRDQHVDMFNVSDLRTNPDSHPISLENGHRHITIETHYSQSKEPPLEPIYQSLSVHSIARQPTPFQQNLAQHSIYGTIGPIRREIHLSHPSLFPPNLSLMQPAIHRQPTPAIFANGTRIAAVQRLPPVAAFTALRSVTDFEDIYDVPKRRTILSEKGTRPPVTYVRPQPNPRLQAALKESVDIASSNRTETIGIGENKKTTATTNNNTGNNSSNINQSDDNNKKSSFSLSLLFSRNKTKSSGHRDEKETNHNSNLTKRSTTMENKKMKNQIHSRSVTNLTSQSLTHVSNSSAGAFRSATGSVVFRPPHSHRFSPPTQWTQV